MFSQLRGKDSTGVGLVYLDKKKKPKVAKAVGGMEQLAYTHPDLFDDVSWSLTELGLKCIIGHNRWQTVGDVNEANAHPFKSNHITGCHNGTIAAHHIRGLQSYEEGITDSQVLINELGRGVLVKDMLSQVGTSHHIPSAWALTWWDNQKKSLNMCRNAERELFVVKSTDGKTLFWASEDWMLIAALDRVGIKHGEIQIVKDDKHLVWKINKTSVVVLESSEDAPGKPAIYNYYNNARQSAVGFLAPWEQYDEEFVPVKQRQKTDEKFARDYTETVPNVLITKPRFESLVEEGCINCLSPLKWEDRDTLAWDDEKTPVCKDCATQFGMVIVGDYE